MTSSICEERSTFLKLVMDVCTATSADDQVQTVSTRVS